MGIKGKINWDVIKQEFNKMNQQLDRNAIRILTRVGEKAVNEAKTNRHYKDDTGNLISSTGYMVFVDGVRVNSFFYSKTEKGKKQGQKIAQEVAKEYNEKYLLVVVAGMDYAVHVENMGLNVLTSAEQLAIKEVNRYNKML